MKDSHIEWTDHTFNPWWGCMKVSEGCKNCYAETLDNRYHHEAPHWGPGSSRKPQSDKYWNEPLKWNREAQKAGIKAKVFCASMADVFEVSEDPVVVEGRIRLWNLIEQTPHLIWQLLTKRPENILPSIPRDWRFISFPENVWFGTSVESQDIAEYRLNALMEVNAIVLFVSVEPMLSVVYLQKWLYSSYVMNNHLNWVICGGESGTKARPVHPDAFRSLRKQCEIAKVPFFFKQHGNWIGSDQYGSDGALAAGYSGKMHKWKDEKPIGPPHFGMNYSTYVSKELAGSLLDGIEYKEFPI